MSLKVLGISGSLRDDSYNSKLIQEALLGAKEEGAEITFINLKDYPLPFYDSDFEVKHGLPKEAQQLKSIIADHDAILLASPEYNGSISGVLKNMMDWTSRKENNETERVWKGKVGIIMTTSTGPMGGIRGLPVMRHICSALGMIVLPDQLALGNAKEVFDKKGRIHDTVIRQRVMGLGKKVAGFAKKMQ